MDAFEGIGMNPNSANHSNTGAPNLRSISILQQLSNDPSSVSMTDIIGLLSGGALGLYVANKFPNAIVKYVGIVAGAEMGIMIARALKR